MLTPLHLKLLAAGATALLSFASLVWQKNEKSGRGRLLRSHDDNMLDAARTLNRGAGLLAFSVAADSAIEHYRGDFHNPAMFTPLMTSALSVLLSIQGQRTAARANSWPRNTVYIGSVLTGLAGTGFHLYNLTRRPGGVCWGNVFHAAPIGAPAALVLSGALGHYAERLRAETRDVIPRVLGLPPAESVGVLAAVGLIGISLETWLLHFRGAFQNPAMYIPVSIPPLAAGLLLASVAAGTAYVRLRWLSRWLLRFTALMGLAGIAFHSLGVARNHGGWRNWRQNLQSGPPLPAPPSFTGLALAGLAAHSLLEDPRSVAS
ncbi:MAG: hypothetical protein WC953_13455 [Pseudomonas sp.]